MFSLKSLGCSSEKHIRSLCPIFDQNSRCVVFVFGGGGGGGGGGGVVVVVVVVVCFGGGAVFTVEDEQLIR